MDHSAFYCALLGYCIYFKNITVHGNKATRGHMLFHSERTVFFSWQKKIHLSKVGRLYVHLILAQT